MKGMLWSNDLACKLLRKIAIFKPKIKNGDFWNSNGDITTGNTVANRVSLLGYTFSEV